MHHHLLALLSLLSLLLLGVTADDYTFNFHLAPNTVPDYNKQDWCDHHTLTCHYICDDGGALSDFGGTHTNACNPSDFTFECRCNVNDGALIKISDYYWTVPGLMCGEAWHRCIQTNDGNKDMQIRCTAQLYKYCPHGITKQQFTKKMKLLYFFHKVMKKLGRDNCHVIQALIPDCGEHKNDKRDIPGKRDAWTRLKLVDPRDDPFVQPGQEDWYGPYGERGLVGNSTDTGRVAGNGTHGRVVKDFVA